MSVQARLVWQAVLVVWVVGALIWGVVRILTADEKYDPPIVWEDPDYPVMCYRSPGEPWQCLVVAVEYVGQQD